MSNELPSYRNIYSTHHREANFHEYLKEDIYIEEKIDGSQFSFGIVGGELKIRSKGQQINPYNREGMFSLGIQWVSDNKDLLTPNFIYRGEFLSKPKHNVLAYNRTPKHNIIIYDIDRGFEDYLTYEDKYAEAKRLDLEVVPLLFSGKLTSEESLKPLLERKSILGGEKNIEGFVIKRQPRVQMYGPDKKSIIIKYVSQEFKEVHKQEWKEKDTLGDIIDQQINSYRTDARWSKAVIHLREKGLIQDHMRDMAVLAKEVPEDILKDSEQDIKNALFAYAWPIIKRGVTKGLPEWYKSQLEVLVNGEKTS